MPTLTSVTAALLLVVFTAASASAGHRGFADARDNVHAAGIHWLLNNGLAGGCAEDAYCPDDALTRGQVATMLRRLAGHDSAVAPSVDAATVEGFTAAELRGSSGEPGATGPEGPRGPAGSSRVGSTGAAGKDGVDGTNGVDGAPGDDGVDGTNFDAASTEVVVNADHGTDLDNGTALRAAYDGITDASAAKPYVIRLVPGTYSVGQQWLMLHQDHISIVGAGQMQTSISADMVYDPTILMLADAAELRDLTVKNTGGGRGIFVQNQRGVRASSLRRVTIEASSADLDTYHAAIRLDSVTASHVQADSSTLSVRNSTLTEQLVAHGPDTIITLAHSTVAGQLYSDQGAKLLIGASQVDGTIVTSNGGTITCAQSYNSAYVELPSTCQTAIGSGS